LNRFGEEVYFVIKSGNVLETDLLGFDFFSNEMILNADVLGIGILENGDAYQFD